MEKSILDVILFSRIEAEVNLHPSTDPAAIADRQRKVVGAAWNKGYRKVSAISRRVVLPEWVVRRRLAELGHEVEAAAAREPARGRGAEVRDKVVAFLRGRAEATTEEIADGAGLTPGSVGSVVRRNRILFRWRKACVNGRVVFVWKLHVREGVVA